MSEFKVPVTKILEIKPHTNSDFLEFAVVYGFNVIVRKDTYKVGDVVVYIPIDSVLSQKLHDKLFSPDTKKRIDGITSKYKGVCKHGNGFVAQISINGIRNYIGYFKNELDAAIAYNKAAKKYFGKFSNLNKLDN